MPISQIVTNSIANGAVAAVDLAAGAALSNLGTAQLARANMAPGSVIQTVTAISGSGFQASGAGTMTAVTTLQVSITPLSASNRLIVTLHSDIQQNSLGDTHVFLGKNLNGAGWVEARTGDSGGLATAQNAYAWVYLYGGATNGVSNAVLNGHATMVFTAGTTGPILIRPYIGCVNGGPATFGNHASTYIVVQEIAA